MLGGDIILNSSSIISKVRLAPKGPFSSGLSIRYLITAFSLAVFGLNSSPIHISTKIYQGQHELRILVAQRLQLLYSVKIVAKLLTSL